MPANRSHFLNLLCGGIELALWYILTCAISVYSLALTPALSIPFLFLNFGVMLYHFYLFVSLHRFIVASEGETMTFIHLWVVMLFGQASLLAFGFAVYWAVGIILSLVAPGFVYQLLTRKRAAVRQILLLVIRRFE
ncbi:MAG: hypothetical protein SWY16_04600 [Cyanobacteriota bacterium]|nr:hypothetical protein [Cyanobacteriota bacterium]